MGHELGAITTRDVFERRGQRLVLARPLLQTFEERSLQRPFDAPARSPPSLTVRRRSASLGPTFDGR